MNVIRFNYPEAKEVFESLLNGEDPVWIGRNGGSDTDFVEKWDGLSASHPSVDLIKRLNGYYDPHNSVENLHKFKAMYLQSSANTDLCTVHMSSVFGGALEGDPTSSNKLQYLYGINNIMCWRFLENCTYFLESFREWGQDKTILVVSPFSESIQHQTQPDRVTHLHKPEFRFPQCVFKTLQTPITYNTEDWMCSEQEGCWFDTAELIFERIQSIDFDIAWLSCGSYAMYLGDRIKRDLGKKSIYTGGMINVFFNLYNFRYSSTGHDTSVINPEYQIQSFETEKLWTENNLSRFPFSEGLRAYLGVKT